MSIFDRVFGPRKPNVIELAHGKERYDIDFAPGSIEDGTITVGELRNQAARVTNTPAENVRLLFRGKNLSNDSVKLCSVGMKGGSKVLCMASQSPLSSRDPISTTVAQGRSLPGSGKAAPVAKSPVDQLSELLMIIKQELEPLVERFVSDVPIDGKERKETHDRLAELLLQKLFSLDGIACSADALEEEKAQVRQKRKEGVKYTQGLLDSVDDVVRDDSVATQTAGS